MADSLNTLRRGDARRPDGASAWSRLRPLAGRTEVYLAVVIVVLAAAIGLATDEFLTFRNLFNLLEAYSVTAIFALGLFVVLVSGNIDISFAGTAAVTQYLTARVLVELGGDWATAFLMAGAIGVLIGFVNAVLVHTLKVISIIITISMMSILFGLLMYFTRGRSIYNLPRWFDDGVVLFSIEFGEADRFDMTLPLIAVAVVAVVTWIMMNRMAIGRQLYALGGNPEAAQRMGCNILGLNLLAYGYMGLLAGVAGIVQAQRVKEVVPNALINSELDVLAAVVLGGASLAGGVGTVAGTLLGIILLAVIQNGLTLLGVSSFAHNVVIGLVILAAVSATAYSARLRRRKSANND